MGWARNGVGCWMSVQASVQAISYQLSAISLVGTTDGPESKVWWLHEVSSVIGTGYRLSAISYQSGGPGGWAGKPGLAG